MKLATMMPRWSSRQLTTFLHRFVCRRQRGAPSVAAIAAELESLNRLTEKDFLRVGEKLMEIRSSARQISSEMSALSELISGQATRDACVALEQVLEYSRGMGVGIKESGEQLGNVLVLSGKLRQAFSGLSHTVSFFRTICTLTRIETTRLGGAGVDFGNLADDVKPLSEQIQLSGDGVLHTASELDRGVQSAISQGRNLEARELKTLNSLSETILRSLSQFEQRREQSQKASSEQASQYAGICDAIEDLVGSIQCHDITRQQMEHVAAVLRSADFSRTDIGLVLELQESQLSEAARTFTESVQHIENDLDGIATRVSEMAQSSRDLMGISSQDHASFFVNMEGTLASILESAGACNVLASETRRLEDEVRPLVKGMQASITDIRRTEFSIERIAINATIHAAQIGEAGTALNVVAESMRRLAMNSNEKTEQVSAMLDSMLTVLIPQSGRTELAGCQGELFQQTRATIGGLHALADSSLSRVGQIAALGAGLAEEIGALRRDFAAGQVFAEKVGHVRAVLGDLRSSSAPALPNSDAASAAHQLARLAEGYTMQKQREVHETVIAGTSPTVPLIQLPERPALESDLGGNVELF